MICVYLYISYYSYVQNILFKILYRVPLVIPNNYDI